VSGDRVEAGLRDSLLSDLHGQPVICIKDNRIEALNKSARSLFGFDPTGRHVSDAFDEKSAKKIARLLSSRSNAARTELQIEHTEAPPSLVSFTVARASDGDLFLIGLSQGVTYPEAVGQQLLVAIEDLTALLRRVGREMHDVEAAKASLERIESLREVFVAALAHDLRSPLQAVLLAEKLLEEAEGDARLEHIERHRKVVERNIRSALDLVDSVVAAARLDAANPELRIEKIQITEVARQWVDALAPTAVSADVSLRVIGAADLPDVHADPIALGEVFSNLLSNAIRHSPHGGEVTVETAKQEEQLVCCVADKGPGIPLSDRSKIFDKFFQGHSSPGMSGLGLYISRRIVELHGGRIWVEDNTPHGSRFVFTMPITQDPKSRSTNKIA
jgi:signal transduction histidine kinase